MHLVELNNQVIVVILITTTISEEKMEATKELVKKILFNEYVASGKVLSFQAIQNILISHGYSYYVHTDGKKKLRIGRKIRSYYWSIRRRLDKMKQERDTAVEIINKVLNANVSSDFKKELYKALSPYLTTQDKNFYSALLKKKRNNRDGSKEELTLKF